MRLRTPSNTCPFLIKVHDMERRFGPDFKFMRLRPTSVSGTADPPPTPLLTEANHLTLDQN
eukprot:700300-Amphidinium_carterae.1